MATPNRRAPAQTKIAQYLPLEKTLRDASEMASRFQDGQGFRQYVVTRLPLVVPAGLLILLISVACAAAVVIFLADRHPMLALPGLILAPLVLLASLFVQLYVFFGWLESRALTRALGHRTGPKQGPVGRWMAKNLRVEMGELPPVPWSLAAIFVVLPLALLVVISTKAGLVLIVLAVLTPMIFARLDR